MTTPSGAPAVPEKDTIPVPSKSEVTDTTDARGDAAVDDVNPVDFDGAVRTDNKPPSPDVLRRIADLPVLDNEGRVHPFGRVVSGQPGERVLVIFVRHFLCGNCQTYLRVLSAALPPARLRAAAAATRIVVVGCGDPALIDMYVEATACAYPLYADPTRRLYDELGMVSTLALGTKPAYMSSTSMLASILRSIGQGLRQIPRGLANKAGNQRQVGGEFLFETRSTSEPGSEAHKALAEHVQVTWCHRMKTTRDHAEVDEIQKVLNL